MPVEPVVITGMARLVVVDHVPETVKGAAVLVLQRLAFETPTNRSAVAMFPEIFEALTSLLEGGARNAAIALVADLAAADDFKDDLTDAVPAIVALLDEDRTTTALAGKTNAEMAATALQHLVQGHAVNQHAARNAGAVPKLLRLVDGTGPGGGHATWIDADAVAPVLVGLTYEAQWWIRDPAAPGGIARSPLVRVTIE